MHIVLLSKHFRKEGLDFSTVRPMVKGTRQTLREIITLRGPAEEEFFSSLEVNKFKGDKLFDIHIQKPAFDEIKGRYVGSLIDEIEKKISC